MAVPIDSDPRRLSQFQLRKLTACEVMRRLDKHSLIRHLRAQKDTVANVLVMHVTWRDEATDTQRGSLQDIAYSILCHWCWDGWSVRFDPDEKERALERAAKARAAAPSVRHESPTAIRDYEEWSRRR